MAAHDSEIANTVDVAILHGVARPCPDCGEERLFVPTEPDDGGCYCCTWCGAALLIDVAAVRIVAAAETSSRGVA